MGVVALGTKVAAKLREPGVLGRWFAAIVSLLVVLHYFRRFLWPELKKVLDSGPSFQLVQHTLLLLLILIVLRWIYVGLPGIGNLGAWFRLGPARLEAFPSASTLLVAVLLGCIGVVCLLGLFLALYPPPWPDWMLKYAPSAGSVDPDHIRGALITMFAAGIGSCIMTLLEFNRSASIEKNFDRARIPWYVGRPVIGMLLALIFYFLVRAGLFAGIGGNGDRSQALDPWSLASIGALVGLFSNQAIYKLKDVFDTLFHVRKEQASKVLAGLPDGEKLDLLKTLPAEARPLLARLLYPEKEDVTGEEGEG